MKKTIQIGGAKAETGAAAHGELAIAPLADGTMLSLPVVIVNGRYDGPVLWLNAALHGNELTAWSRRCAS